MKPYLLVVICSLLASCAAEPPSPPMENLGNVEVHTYDLAEELFGMLDARYPQTRQFRYAVTTFVPVASLKYAVGRQHPLMLLGHQLEQGMMTEASRRGYITQDFKISNDILVEEQADRVLSRDVKQLSGAQAVDFYITGTLTEQQNGAVVNARIVHAQSRTVVASATRFFPDDLFWRDEQVTLRDGMIYRHGTME
ncbi:FlgO family outer membrane protein [Bowmanella dokdonensis]|nr:FlgO family outer membrane protein [Bowmanella dokdonensis]